MDVIAKRLLTVAETLGHSYEIIWVNDGSSDRTGERLDRLAAASPIHRPLHLSRNFGHMAALTAGLDAARASGAIISLDADGQHPPELIPELVRHWSRGADVVQTVRQSTADESLLKRSTSHLFYRLLRELSGLELPDGTADFRLLDRQVVDALNSLPERVRFLRGLVYWVGYKTVYLPYEAPRRLSGTTKYNFRAMLKFALNGITSFSVKPLRVVLVLGFIVLVLALLYAIYALVANLLGYVVPGWTSLLLVTLILSGVQLLTLGIASEYLGRIYEEVKHRPVYLLRRPREPENSTGYSPEAEDSGRDDN